MNLSNFLLRVEPGHHGISSVRNVWTSMVKNIIFSLFVRVRARARARFLSLNLYNSATYALS